uniref:(northern house mosquito) hypothetical protein n=1 Tax=Culex pipiens TaxID=7175 RepID=A0A8D8JI54_CULPI
MLLLLFARSSPTLAPFPSSSLCLGDSTGLECREELDFFGDSASSSMLDCLGAFGFALLFQPQFFHLRDSFFFTCSGREPSPVGCSSPALAPPFSTRTTPSVVVPSIVASLFIISCCVDWRLLTNSTSRSSNNMNIHSKHQKKGGILR